MSAHYQVETLRGLLQTTVYRIFTLQVADVETGMALGDVDGAAMTAPTAIASMGGPAQILLSGSAGGLPPSCLGTPSELSIPQTFPVGRRLHSSASHESPNVPSL